jgi:hypothetical protein
MRGPEPPTAGGGGSADPQGRAKKEQSKICGYPKGSSSVRTHHPTLAGRHPENPTTQVLRALVFHQRGFGRCRRFPFLRN